MRRILLATILPAALLLHIAIRFAFATEINSKTNYNTNANEVAIEINAVPIEKEDVVELIAVAN